MKVDKKKLIATLGALGLTAGVLAGCGSNNSNDDDYVKVVDSDGQIHYIDEDELDDDGGNGLGFFMLYSMWNGKNHSKLKPVSGYHGKMFSSKPKVSTGAKSSAKSATSGKSSGVGAKASSGAKSSGFGG